MLNFSRGAKAKDVASACGGKLIYEGTSLSSSAVIDSRKAQGGTVFAAICGENTDGHLYMASAAEKGASAVICEKAPCDLSAFEKNNCSVILVDNTVKALGKLASAHKSECKALTVGVTGSVGKTTTRQFIASVLAVRFSTHKTEGNFNNDLGLPLTILGLKDTHEAAVVEMGMSARGEISYLTKITRPSIGVITTIGSSHIEHLGSREGIRDAKLEILDGMDENGVLILNGDEPLLDGIESAVYVSLRNDNCPYYAENIKITESGSYFDAHTPSFTVKDCFIPTLGEHTVLDAMYAVAVGEICGLNADEIKAGLSSFASVGMRQNIEEVNGITFIRDYYNASPESIKASLSVTKRLAGEKNGRTVAVIGNVLELGVHSEAMHRSVGKYAADIDTDLLFTFGDNALFVADEAAKSGMDKERIFSFTDISDPNPISEEILKQIKKGDCVLIKASHGIDMGRIANLIIK